MSRGPIDPVWLSAYLDGELDAGERAQVERELAGSEQARRQLAELAALDEVARAHSVEAPPGYFESLPARVRARLAGPARPRAGLPRWGLALAAALIVAAILPFLALRSHRPESAAGVGEAREAVAPRPSGPRRETAPAVTLAPRLAARDDAGEEASPDGGASAAALIPDRVAAAAPTPPATLPPPPATPAPVEEARPQRPRAPGFRPDATRLVEAEVADAVGTASEADLADEFGGRAGVEPDGPRGHPSERRRRQELAAEPAQPAAQSAGVGRKLTATVEGDTVLGFAPAPDTAARVAELNARRPPESAEEARQLREAWRSLVAAQPQDSSADEARVRVVELGIRAFALGGERADLETARRDAEAYLARPDAAQRPRVEELLRELPD